MRDKIYVRHLTYEHLVQARVYLERAVGELVVCEHRHAAPLQESVEHSIFLINAVIKQEENAELRNLEEED